MNKTHWLTILGIFLQSLASAQTVLQDAALTQYYPKMILEKGEDLSIPSDTLMLDTLIMKEGSKLTFLRKSSLLVVAHAVIGMNCVFSASGRHGSDGTSYTKHGENGENGRALTVSLRFESLGSLLVDARGGDGGWGGNSHDGGSGGRGGDGGDINFFYLAPHFVVVLEESREHSLQFNNIGGFGGLGGKGEAVPQPPVQSSYYGTRYVSSTGFKGQDGAPGANGRMGNLRYLRTGGMTSKEWQKN
jgi:hypothetical protein